MKDYEYYSIMMLLSLIASNTAENVIIEGLFLLAGLIYLVLLILIVTKRK